LLALKCGFYFVSADPMKKLARLILRALAVPLFALVLLGIGGQLVGRATGLRIQNYIPPNLTPSIEIVCVVVQENQASDLFQLPN
jgi:hypothetical protein